MRRQVFFGMFLIAGIFLFLSFRTSSLLEKSYIIEEHQLSLHGSSNVNEFSCTCEQKFDKSNIRFEYLYDWAALSFQKAALGLKVTSFDCGKKAINKDLQEALKAEEYPNINIKLLDIKHKTQKLLSESTDWVDMQANASITLAGVTLITELDIQGKKLSDQKFQFKCVKTLKMTDFNIDPPSVMFGIIKVKDEISIDIDLVVLVENA